MTDTSKERKYAKILLMGKARVGKTSMRSIIFANQAPKDTFILASTKEEVETRLKFMGNLLFNLYDCGGQEEFIKEYFETKKDSIFSKVEVLIFVIEAANQTNPKDEDNIEDVQYFEDCIKALNEYSKDAKVFVLVHKMDLIEPEKKQEIFEKRKAQIFEKANGKVKFLKVFPTSIWEMTLYKAWTNIVQSLISTGTLKKHLEKLALACGAEEVNLFEKNTFILTGNYSTKEINEDDQKFEKISHIIKKFKLSCMTSQAKFKSMVIQTKNFTAYLDEFTNATYIMIVINDKNVSLELLKLNVALAKDEFEKAMHV